MSKTMCTCPRRFVGGEHHKNCPVNLTVQQSNERDGTLGEVIDRRVQVYGNPVETFARIAQVWSGIIGHEIQPWEVPLMMAGMKMVRADVMPDYSDNSDDIDGYLDIFRKIIGEDMIHARTVNEFIEKKWPAEPTIMVCHAHGVPVGFCATCNPEIREYTVDEPVPYQVVDGFDCIEAGRHLRTQRHTEAECPAVRDGE